MNKPGKTKVMFSVQRYIYGELLFDGLVLHESLYWRQARRGIWSVSDSETGTLVCFGVWPGREGAMAALIQLIADEYGSMSAFQAAVAKARAREWNRQKIMQASLVDILRENERQDFDEECVMNRALRRRFMKKNAAGSLE
ncbi:MAG: hypothetical protein LBO00_07540 [Zoogloeaceae bacterium]|jgi:hypothetical protein|nr:hypothetical protein [Zoogloeaceae bacterium]